MIRHLQRAGLVRSVGALAAAVGLSAVVNVPASGAWEPLATEYCETGSVFDSPEADLVFHTTDFLGTAAQTEELTDAVLAVVDQFNTVGGTSARIKSVSYTTAPSVYGVAHGDTTPTIHVTFVPGLPNPTGSTILLSACPHTEAHIWFKDVESNAWNFGTPGHAGSGLDLQWFEASNVDALGQSYFRETLLHELLHAFGLDHATNQYALTNYYTKAWANRDPDEMLMPLPDDVQGLRSQYPATIDEPRYDIALFNSWFRHGTRDDLPGQHEFLCAPSRGARISSGPLTEHCGTGGAAAGSTLVCEGDYVNMRVTVANFSTVAMDMQVRVAASKDPFKGTYEEEEYFANSTVIGLGPAKTSVLQLRWPAPALSDPGADYYLIADVVGWEQVAPGQVPGGQTLVSDWTPLTGKIQACD